MTALDPILKRFSTRTDRVDLHYHTALVSFEDGPEGVRATVREHHAAFIGVDHEPLRAAQHLHRALSLQRLGKRGEAIAFLKA